MLGALRGGAEGQEEEGEEVAPSGGECQEEEGKAAPSGGPIGVGAWVVVSGQDSTAEWARGIVGAVGKVLEVKTPDEEQEQEQLQTIGGEGSDEAKQTVGAEGGRERGRRRQEGGRGLRYVVEWDVASRLAVHELEAEGEARGGERRKVVMEEEEGGVRRYWKESGEDLQGRGMQLLLHHGSLALAEQLLREALALQPHDSDALAGLALLLHAKKRDPDAAEALLNRSLAVNPSHADSLCNLGGICLDDSRKQYTRAERLFRRCLDEEPEHVMGLAFYGLLLQEIKKEYSEAERLMLKAIRINPLHTDSLSHYATFLGKVHHNYAAANVLYDR